jgi:hypothetical protein
VVNYSAPVRLAFLDRDHPTGAGANHTLRTALKAVNRLPARQRVRALIYFDQAAELSARSPLRASDIEELSRPMQSALPHKQDQQ